MWIRGTGGWLIAPAIGRDPAPDDRRRNGKVEDQHARLQDRVSHVAKEVQHPARLPKREIVGQDVDGGAHGKDGDQRHRILGAGVKQAQHRVEKRVKRQNGKNRGDGRAEERPEAEMAVTEDAVEKGTEVLGPRADRVPLQVKRQARLVVIAQMGRALGDHVEKRAAEARGPKGVRPAVNQCQEVPHGSTIRACSNRAQLGPICSCLSRKSDPAAMSRSRSGHVRPPKARPGRDPELSRG